MNFFRKKDHVFVSIVPDELNGPTEKLRDSLLGVLPVPSGNDLKISLGSAPDLPVKNLTVIMSFVTQLKSDGIKVVFTASNEILDAIAAMGLSSYFDTIEREK